MTITGTLVGANTLSVNGKEIALLHTTDSANLASRWANQVVDVTGDYISPTSFRVKQIQHRMMENATSG
jgi:hypothetical protein